MVQDRRRRGFFTIDNALIDRYGAQLKAHGLAVYTVLARFADRAGECFPSQATIAKRTGMSRMQVSREIDQLKRLQLIAVEAQHGPQGEQIANLYILLDVPTAAEGVTVSATPDNSVLHPPVTVSDTPCNGVLHKQDLKNKTKQNKTQRTTRAVENPANNNSSAAPAHRNVVVALADQGIAEKVAQRLTSHYSPTRIEEKIDYLRYLQAEAPAKVKNPCGWLRRAIEEDYSPPDGYKSPADRAAAIAAQQRWDEAMQQALAAEPRCQEERLGDDQQKAAAWRTHLAQTYGTTQRELDLWHECLAEFKLTMPSATFQTCVADTMLLSLQHDEALIGLSNPAARDSGRESSGSQNSTRLVGVHRCAQSDGEIYHFGIAGRAGGQRNATCAIPGE